MGDGVGAVPLQAQRGLCAGEAGRGGVHLLEDLDPRAGADRGQTLADEPGTGLELGGLALAAGGARRCERGRGTGVSMVMTSTSLHGVRAARSRAVTWSDHGVACGDPDGPRARRRAWMTRARRSWQGMRKEGSVEEKNAQQRERARGQRSAAAVRTQGKVSRSQGQPTRALQGLRSGLIPNTSLRRAVITKRPIRPERPQMIGVPVTVTRSKGPLLSPFRSVVAVSCRISLLTSGCAKARLKVHKLERCRVSEREAVTCPGRGATAGRR